MNGNRNIIIRKTICVRRKGKVRQKIKVNPVLM